MASRGTLARAKAASTSAGKPWDHAGPQANTRAQSVRRCRQDMNRLSGHGIISVCMKLLALDTSTEILSVAVCRDGAEGEPRLWQHSGAGGAQASSTLIPTIMALLNDARLRLDELDAIAFGAGPGSFTGFPTRS